MPEETFIFFFFLVNFGVLHAQSGKTIFFSELFPNYLQVIDLKISTQSNQCREPL